MILTSDSRGNPVSCIDQEAYGNVKVGSQSGYHLTTKEYDSHPELYYFYQRWYDPVLGRFISKSPYPGFVEHKYGYVRNNPLRRIDPSGNLDADYVQCVTDCTDMFIEYVNCIDDLGGAIADYICGRIQTPGSAEFNRCTRLVRIGADLILSLPLVPIGAALHGACQIGCLILYEFPTEAY